MHQELHWLQNQYFWKNKLPQLKLQGQPESAEQVLLRLGALKTAENLRKNW